MSKCVICGKEDDLRISVCFDCASSKEEQASKRSVVGHIKKGLTKIYNKEYRYAKYDFIWAWERLTRTGDYKKGGTFDFEGYDWR